MPKVSDVYLEERRRQILVAAARCFGRKGIAGTSMRDIYRESGLSSGAVYHYYRSKQEIVDAVFEMSLQQTDEVMGAPMAVDDPIGALDAVLDVVFGILDDPAQADDNRTGVVIAGEAVRDERVGLQYRRLYDDMFERLGGVVTAAQQRGQIDASLDPQYVARVMFSVYEGYRIQKLIDPSADTRRFTSTLRALLDLGAASRSRA